MKATLENAQHEEKEKELLMKRERREEETRKFLKTFYNMFLPAVFVFIALLFYYMQPKQPGQGLLFQTAHLKFADKDKKLDLKELYDALSWLVTEHKFPKNLLQDHERFFTASDTDGSST